MIKAKECRIDFAGRGERRENSGGDVERYRYTVGEWFEKKQQRENA